MTLFALSVDSPAQAIGAPTSKNGVPVQRFVKKVIPVGNFVKRNKTTGEIVWKLDVTKERQQKWADAFKAMKEGGIPVRLKDESGAYSLDAPKASPLTKNHAGVFDKDRKAGLKNMVENIVGETIDMYVDGDWLTTVHDVEGQASIDLVKKAKFTSPEIQDCYFDGTDKEYGEVIRAISLVSNPIIPGQPEFEPIAASEDSPDIFILSLEEEPPMKTAAILAAIAGLAGVSVAKVTEDNAVDMIKGVQNQREADADKIKAMSDEQIDPPSKSERRSGARLAIVEINRLQNEGVLSEAGCKELSTLMVGKVDTAEYSPFIMSAEDSDELDDRVQLIEKIAGVFLKNPGVKKGPKTPLQDLKALGEEEGGGAGAAPKQMTAERIKEVLEMTTVGREIVSAATSK